MKKFLFLVVMQVGLIGCGGVMHGGGHAVAMVDGVEVGYEREQIVEAAEGLLASFEGEDLGKVLFAFEDKGRTQWSFLPAGMVKRQGIGLNEMSDDQRVKLRGLLSRVLSSKGYLKSEGIMRLDDLLKVEANAAAMKRGHEYYYFTFWGKPSAEGKWGFRFEGHHLSLNFTFATMVASGRVAVTPMFLGTNPARVKRGDFAGLRVLGEEEDLGFALLDGLSEKQKRKAVLKRGVPGDILTGPGAGDRLKDYWGISGGEMNDKQRGDLMRLIGEYIGNLEGALADERMGVIKKAGLDQVYFSWIGETVRSDRYYYLVHGPKFIIEFDNHRNHVHSIWREKGEDFGQDILREHLEGHTH